MTFVFSFWYIVLALLAVGIVAAIIAFVKMDKKDRVLIDNFIKESTEEVEEKETEKPSSETEKKE